jgi:tetraacyldisaccharide 4'-kinase
MKLYEMALIPLAVLNRGITSARRAAYRSGRLAQEILDRPVISVGNLTTGGTGKTPMVLYLAERLVGEGEKPAILTRGYGGPSQAMGTDGRKLADEPALLLHRLSSSGRIGVNFFICEGAARWESGRRASAMGATCFLLDDGFQHLVLVRDLDIVMVDAMNPFGNGHLLPAGQLREAPSALRDADIVVVTRGPGDGRLDAELRKSTSAPIFRSTTLLEAFCSAGMELERNSLFGTRAFAFCAIGNPETFFRDLNSWGVEIVGHREFRDHHKFSQAEMARLRAEAKAKGAKALVCTEKDVFNLPPEDAGSADVFYCRISMELHDPKGFWAVVHHVMGRKSGGTKL